MTRTAAVETGADARVAMGARVREVRAARGLSLRDLASRLEVSPATLSAVENGRTGLSAVRLARVAQLLDAPVEVLLAPPGSAGLEVVGGPHDPAGAEPVRIDWRAYPPAELEAPLQAALSAFLEIGYHGATMRDIARRAHLSVPGVYHYHASKQEMLVAILDFTMADLIERCRAARDDGRDPVERFSNLVECLALFHTHRRELGFVGASEMRSLEPESHVRVAADRTTVQRMVDDEVEAGVAQGMFATDRPHEASRAVATMCTALAQWFSAQGSQSAEEVARHYVAFALGLVRYRG